MRVRSENINKWFSVMVEFREFGLAQGCLDSDGADDDDGGGSSDCDRKDGRESVEFNRL